MADHANFTVATDVKVYFCDPQSPWQRGRYARHRLRVTPGPSPKFHADRDILWLDAAEVRPVLVSQLMGHAAPARQIGAAQITQERYTHALPGELERAREQFDRWLADATEARDELLARP